jgi:hypothetical protein
MQLTRLTASKSTASLPPFHPYESSVNLHAFFVPAYNSSMQEVSLPDDLNHALDAAGLRDTFMNMSPSHRKEYLKWIDEAKKPETRQRRLEKMLEMIAAGQKFS